MRVGREAGRALSPLAGAKPSAGTLLLKINRLNHEEHEEHEEQQAPE
jgi:hypothetical protein